MKCRDLKALLSMKLPEIPPDFFQRGTFEKQHKRIPIGTIVTLHQEYYRRGYHNPERVWGFVTQNDPYIDVRWSTGVRNDYVGGCLCTLEEFMSEHGSALPYSWRS